MWLHHSERELVDLAEPGRITLCVRMDPGRAGFLLLFRGPLLIPGQCVEEMQHQVSCRHWVRMELVVPLFADLVEQPLVLECAIQIVALDISRSHVSCGILSLSL